MSASDTRRPASDPPDQTGGARDTARRRREYGHSSGDRNVRHDEDDAPSHGGGVQREATPEDKDDLKGRD